MSGTPWTLPSGSKYTLLPLTDGPVRLGVLVIETSMKPSLLRSDVGMNSYLGALMDAEDVVLDWVAIHVQSTSNSSLGDPGETNGSRDRVWDRWCDLMSETHGGRLIRTPWAREAPPPLWIDPESGIVVAPEIDGRRLELCRDEAALQAAGLPSYAASECRFLRPEGLADGPFIAAAGTPSTGDAGTLTERIPQAEGWVALNPAAGRIAVRRWSPLGLREAFAVLGGGAWNGVLDGGGDTGVAAELRHVLTQFPSDRTGMLTLGREGHPAETLLLKLRLLADVVEEAAAACRRLGGPLLALHPCCFEVDAAPARPRRNLPLFWTMTATLAEPPMLAARVRDQRNAGIAVPVDASRGSKYQPAVTRQVARGVAAVRVTEVREGEDGVVLHGFAASPDFGSADGALGDRVVLMIPVEGGLECVVHLVPTRDGATELSFTSLAHAHPSSTVEALRRLVGRPMSQVPFESRPEIGSPADGYAIAVMAIEALLTSDEQPLDVAIDAIMGLATAVADRRRKGAADASTKDSAKDSETRPGSSPPPVRTLAALIHDLLEQDPDRRARLDPSRLHRLHRKAVQGDGDPFKDIPAEYWSEVLAWIVRLLPAVGPDSHARGFADPPGVRPEALLEKASDGIDMLIRRGWSLVFMDQAVNQRVESAIQRMLEKVRRSNEPVPLR